MVEDARIRWEMSGVYGHTQRVPHIPSAASIGIQEAKKRLRQRKVVSQMAERLPSPRDMIFSATPEPTLRVRNYARRKAAELEKGSEPAAPVAVTVVAQPGVRAASAPAQTRAAQQAQKPPPPSASSQGIVITVPARRFRRRSAPTAGGSQTARTPLGRRQRTPTARGSIPSQGSRQRRRAASRPRTTHHNIVQSVLRDSRLLLLPPCCTFHRVRFCSYKSTNCSHKRPTSGTHRPRAHATRPPSQRSCSCGQPSCS